MSPALVDAILAGVALELLLGSGLLLRAGAARWIAPFALYLGAGAGLLVALRAALAGGGPAWVAGALAASLVAHAASLASLYRRLCGAGPERDP